MKIIASRFHQRSTYETIELQRECKFTISIALGLGIALDWKPIRKIDEEFI